MSSLQVTDLQTMLAYRLGETSPPSDSTTKALRLTWLNDGYADLARRKNWWWLEKLSTANTNTGASAYNEPSDLKEFIELKIVNTYYDQIPYQDNRIYTGLSVIVTLPQTIRSFKFYRFAGQYSLVPTDSADGSTHNIRYYCRTSRLANDTDTFLLPDEYLPALAAYAESRYWGSILQQAKAQSPMAEYEKIIIDLMKEHNRRGWGSSGYTVLAPEQALGVM